MVKEKFNLTEFEETHILDQDRKLRTHLSHKVLSIYIITDRGKLTAIRRLLVNDQSDYVLLLNKVIESYSNIPADTQVIK